MRKKIIAMLMLVLCVFMLGGCSSVNYAIIIQSDGSITQQFSIYLDESEITAAGKTLNEVKSQIRQTAQNVVNIYDEQFQNNSDLTNEQRAEVLLNKETATIKMESNYVVITLKFKTIQAYRYYYGIVSSDAEDDEDLTDNGFYVKENSTSTTVFHDIANNEIATQFLEYFGEDSGISLSSCKYSFTYSTPSSKLHSDADSIEYDSYGNTAHTWYFTADDLTGENAETGDQINLYTVSFRTPVWYITAVCLTFVLIASLVVVDVVKTKKSKQNMQVNIK
jgi:uncharacterized protein YceK